jgi:hypothetical protein
MGATLIVVAGTNTHPERKVTVMGMDDEAILGKNVSGRWIGGLIALGIVIWVVYMSVFHGFE